MSKASGSAFKRRRFGDPLPQPLMETDEPYPPMTLPNKEPGELPSFTDSHHTRDIHQAELLLTQRLKNSPAFLLFQPKESGRAEAERLKL